MSPRARWNDLGERFVSGVVLVAVGLAAVWIGGFTFHVLIALVSGVMIWELVGMLDSDRVRTPRVLGAAAGIAVLVAGEVPATTAMPLLLAPAMLGFGQMQRGGVTYAVFAALILLAGYGMMAHRDDFGLIWMLWLVLVVVATDIAGYFAGRMIGGPKFWPRVSPKKTWSGTVAGWIAAGALGAVFAALTEAHYGLVPLSIAISMASQLGDIAESAIKRRAGVKDSSNLIPGHGGLFDRFDGMLGAALFILLAGQIVDFPPGLAGPG
ncbi:MULTISPECIES: phosphatidate cytidylyltransferase [unclassified Roseivivax]|uniref:phosphatidate cytidylyltransferase n=1 Tax=Roseivivax sp. GX 12232 TaxID=2900547 RepID=UPI001E2E6751|nr:phosphatidate cytidylyltransferase [Roseivivax sp. GX 12232]MCE0504939.1 phosphatidate cytidylyltransferase [Roseivivax sp. GX 12232]